jgi:iron complex outermembrane receptor protein
LHRSLDWLGLSVAAAAAVVTVSGPVVAQVVDVSAPAVAKPVSGGAFVFGEIVVTARKRDESIQTVPISITAFTQRDLEDRGVQTIFDLRYVTPSLSVQADTFRQDTINVTIRGLRNFPSDGVQFDTAAAVYVDGVYYARTQGLTGALFDIDRVQVLKGPQGTMIGRNSTGGALLYTTREPEDEPGGSVKLTGGDYGRRDVELVLNTPLMDKVAVRAAMTHTERDGYIKNNYFDPATGERNNTPALGTRKTAGLFSVKIEPDDTLKVVLRANLQGQQDTGVSYHNIGFFEGTVPSLGRPSICNIPGTCNQFIDLNGRVIAPYYSNVATRTVNTDPRAYNSALAALFRQQDDFWSTEQALSGYNRGNYRTYSMTVDKDFGDVEFKVVGGLRDVETTGFSSSRGTGYNTFQRHYQDPDYNAYTVDANLTGNSFADSLTWTTGFFYFNESANNQGSKTYLFSVNQPSPQPVVGRQITETDLTRNSGQNISYAGYAQGTYKIRSDLRFTAGFRYTIDQRAALIATQSRRFPATPATTATVPNSVFDPGTFVLNGISYTGITRSCGLTDASGVLLPVNQCAFQVNRTFRKPTWTVALDYDLTPGTMVYATARKGYKSGAINSGSTSPLNTVAGPENVLDYELGLKSDFRIGGVPFRTNLAAYLTDYRNIQVQVALPNIIFASAPGTGAGGGVGPCTQAAFNTGSCSGVSTDQVSLNAKSAEVYGAEWDITAQPIPELTLSWNGSYLHAYYKDFTFAPPPGYLQPVTTANLSGTPFALPQWAMNLSATYSIAGERVHLPVESLSLNVNWYWQSRTLADLTPYNPAQKASGYNFTGVRLTADGIMQTTASLSTFVTNVFNKAACQAEPGGTGGGAGVLNSNPNSSFGVPGTSGIIQCVPLPPRMFGVTLKYAF